MVFKSIYLNAAQTKKVCAIASSQKDRDLFNRLIRETEVQDDRRFALTWRDSIHFSIHGDYESEALLLSIIVDHEMENHLTIVGCDDAEAHDELWGTVTESYEHMTGRIAEAQEPDVTRWASYFLTPSVETLSEDKHDLIEEFVHGLVYAWLELKDQPKLH